MVYALIGVNEQGYFAMMSHKDESILKRKFSNIDKRISTGFNIRSSATIRKTCS